MHASLPFTVLKRLLRNEPVVDAFRGRRACFPTVYGFETREEVFTMDDYETVGGSK